MQCKQTTKTCGTLSNHSFRLGNSWWNVSVNSARERHLLQTKPHMQCVCVCMDMWLDLNVFTALKDISKSDTQKNKIKINTNHWKHYRTTHDSIDCGGLCCILHWSNSDFWANKCQKDKSSETKAHKNKANFLIESTAHTFLWLKKLKETENVSTFNFIGLTY